MKISFLQTNKKYFLIILFFIFGFLIFRQSHAVAWLHDHQKELIVWTNVHPVLSVLIFIVTFIIMLSFAIPCATLLTLLGGFLFGKIAILYCLFSITVGGFFLFLLSRYFFSSFVLNIPTKWLNKIKKGFKDSAFYYLLSLRLVPIAPCWISNVTAGSLDVPVKTFLLSTMIGIIPSTIVYVLAGNSIEMVLLLAEHKSMTQIIFTPAVYLPLVLLGLLSLLPVSFKYTRKYFKR